jgi:hypothetical protein
MNSNSSSSLKALFSLLPSHGYSYDLVERPSPLEGERTGRTDRPLGEGSPQRRGKHILRQKAMELTHKPSLRWENAYGIKDEIVRLAKQYAEEVGDKAIVLKNEETSKILIIPYHTRFSDKYYIKNIEKLKTIPYKLGIHLELTCDPKRFTNLYESKEKMLEGWNKLLTMIRKRYQKLGRKIEFVRIIEFTKKGIIHFHIIIFNITRLIDADELREFWNNKYGIATWVRVERIRHMSRSINYLIKYLEKYLDDEAFKQFQEKHGEKDIMDRFTHLALSWALCLRAFNHSKGILDKGNRIIQTKIESKGIWVLIAIVPLSIAYGWNGKTYSEILGDLLAFQT